MGEVSEDVCVCDRRYKISGPASRAGPHPRILSTGPIEMQVIGSETFNWG